MPITLKLLALHRWEATCIEAVYPLRIVVAEDVSEDNSFDFFTLHSVCRYLIQFFFFQCGKEALHTGIIVAMGSTAKALDEPVCNKFPT